MDKRIIEETPSTEVLNDDWFIKDSPTGGTSKILGSNLKEIISGDVEDSIDKILSSIAPEWSSTSTYGFDAYVIYEGKLWRCFKDTGSTVGEFKTSEWIKAVTSGYISHVIDKIADRFVASNPPFMTYRYSVGDMVFYSEPYHDEQLYVCNTDLPQGESTFNPEHWDVVYTVAGLSKYLMDKIAEAGQVDDVKVDGVSVVDENKVAQITTPDADGISYDNTTSGLEADDVQEAIDEVVGLIAEAGQVDDVKVDGVSVVDENKVAKIDLSNMLIEKSVPNLPQSVATFNDGSDLPLKSLTASIVPVQDLHGYDSPWAGGAGKNKLPLTVDNIKNANPSIAWSGNEATKSGVTFKIETDNNGNVSGIKLNGTATDDIQFLLGIGITFNGDYILNGGLSVSISVAVQGKVLSTGADRAFTDDGTTSRTSWIFVENGTVCNNVVKPMVRLASVADSTFEPYSNICPISGWTEEVITRTGVNAWDEEWEVGLIDHTTGNNTTGNGICSKNYISIKANTNYYAHISTWYRIAFYDDNKIYISGEQPSSNIFTTPTNAKYMKFSTNALYGTTYNNDISINYPSTDTEYHAYSGTTTTIPFIDSQGNPVEVYGGSVDVVNGTSGNIRTRAGVDLGSLTWTNLDSSGGIYRYQATIDDMKTKDARSMDIECSCYKSNIGGGAYDDGTIYNVSSPNRLVIVTSLYSNITDFQNSLSGQKAVYELATPTTFYTQPTSIKSLDGENNVRASTGQIEDLEYIANATDVIANLEARVTALENQ